MESQHKNDMVDYMNIGPVDTKKHHKEETSKVEEENIYEEPESFNHRFAEARRETKLRDTKKVCFRQEEKQEEPEKASDIDNDYDIVIQPSTESALGSYGNDDDTYLYFWGASTINLRFPEPLFEAHAPAYITKITNTVCIILVLQ